jgi:hypothetical protein
MKYIYLLILSLVISSEIYTQQAADYFPGTPGFTWHFKVTPLDSLNNPIEEQAVYQVDSFATVESYRGKTAKVVLSKTGPYDAVLFQPYIDTSYISPEGTNGFTYFNVSSFLSSAGSILPDTSLIGLLKSFENWYSVYRFGSNVGTNYTIFSYDTTVTIDTVTVPLRFQFRGRRLADETITTELGNFNSKKFLISGTISYLISFPPLPPIPVQILGINDSVWIAPERWIVKSVTPSSTVNLSFLGLGSFTLPGVRQDYTAIVIQNADEEGVELSDYNLYENYPNPFNPETNIRFSIGGSELTKVKIVVHDVLGNLITTLIEEERMPGIYGIKFRGENLSSGVYFFTLQTKDIRITKKMNYIK